MLVGETGEIYTSLNIVKVNAFSTGFLDNF